MTTFRRHPYLTLLIALLILAHPSAEFTLSEVEVLRTGLSVGALVEYQV